MQNDGNRDFVAGRLNDKPSDSINATPLAPLSVGIGVRVYWRLHISADGTDGAWCTSHSTNLIPYTSEISDVSKLK